MAYLIKGDPGPARTAPIAPDPLLPRACVIGAGSSGIAAAKALYEARIPFDCFELGPVVGGNWVYRNPNGLSGCYSTLEMNTSCPRMAYSDFPPPAHFNDYPMHDQVAEYFEAYVDHFGFRHTLTFNTRVDHVEQTDDGSWEVTISGAGAGGGSEVRRYDAVLVANGHHHEPRWPDPPFPGEFAGRQMHAHDYDGPAQLTGHRVVVLGVGNSGMDIATAAARHGEAAFLAARRGAHIIRKRLGGKPVDQVLAPPWLPWSIKQKGFELMRLRSGNPTKLGMPKPDHKVGHAHPTLSDTIWEELESGRVTPKPNIERLDGDGVIFADGSREEADLIIYCTGYNVVFPFFDPDFISAPGNDLPLYLRTLHPEIAGVSFIGLMQPLGAVMPIAEKQGVWIAKQLRGEYEPPSEGEMRESIEAKRRSDAKRFYESDRHTMEVDFDEWMGAVDREIATGAKRAPAPTPAPA